MFTILPINDTTTNWWDVLAIGVGVASFAQLLPYVSAALTIVWMGLRVYILVRDEIFGKKKGRKDVNE